MNLQKRPLFPLLFAYVCGIVLAGLACYGRGLDTVVISFAVACMAIAIYRKSGFAVLILLLSCCAAGYLYTTVCLKIPPEDVSRYADGRLVDVWGRVVSDVTPLGDRIQFSLRVERVRTYEGLHSSGGNAAVTLFRPREHRSVRTMGAPGYGDLVCIHGRLRRPGPARNPGSMDYRRYLAMRRSFSVLNADPASVRIIGHAGLSVTGIGARLRESLVVRARSLFPPVHAMLVLGLLIGNYGLLPSALQTAYIRSGTMHVLSASGYNCGVVIGLLGFLLRRLTVHRSLSCLLSITAVWGFAFLSGCGPSIMRASIMVTVMLAAYLFRRAVDLPNAMMFAALVILGMNPLSLYDIGFQLSFAALLSLILIMPIAQDLLGPLLRAGTSRRDGRMASLVFMISRVVLESIIASSAVFVGTWPVTAFHFGYVSTVSMLANALIAPLVILITVLGISSLALSVICHALGHIVALAATMLSQCMFAVAGQLGGHEWALLSTGSPSSIFLLVYYVLLLGVVEYAYRCRAKAKKSAGCAGGTAGSGGLVSSPGGSGQASRGIR